MIELKVSKKWDYKKDDWYVGGRIPMNNQSEGYHGLLKQWWDYYKIPNSTWMLASKKI